MPDSFLLHFQDGSIKEKMPRPLSVEQKMEEQLQEFEAQGDGQCGAVASLVK